MPTGDHLNHLPLLFHPLKHQATKLVIHNSTQLYLLADTNTYMHTTMRMQATIIDMRQYHTITVTSLQDNNIKHITTTDGFPKLRE